MDDKQTQPPAGRQGQVAARSDDAAGIVSEDTAPAEAGAQTRGLPAFTPVPRAKDRSNGWKPQVQQAFIEALADTGSVRAACRRVGRSEHGAYQLRRHPEAAGFRAAWQAALDHGIARIEDVAMDRALNGVEVPVYSYGKLLGSRTVYNDRLLMFLLRNRAPERFADGRARALNALDKLELARLKKQWRAEWEAESAAEEQEVFDSIDALIDEMRSRTHRPRSPRAQAAYDHYLAVQAQDEASGYCALTDPDHPEGAARLADLAARTPRLGRGRHPLKPPSGLGPQAQASAGTGAVPALAFAQG
ncbi:MAG: hypothetical protein B7X57_04710 [Erythrobacter sp. 34-65-8]|nr:MAG: hypothetical protein B7X57_04710 [Erythrobacter sp. 34-65-8]